MNNKSTGNIKGVASIFWTQDQQVIEEYMMKMIKSICFFVLLWDSCVDGSFGVYSLCKIQSDPLHCCGCQSVGHRNYLWCRHISREGRQFRLIVEYKDSVNIHRDWKFALPNVDIQGWLPLGLTGLILLSKGLSRSFSSTTVWKH